MIRVRQVKIEVCEDYQEKLKKAIAKKLKISEKAIKDYQIKKQSLDAREKPKLSFVYEVDVVLEKEENYFKKNHHKDVFLSPKEEYLFPKSGTEKMKNRPVIVGSGPAGLFAAYLLAEHHYHPIIIERGEKVEDRIQTVSQFWKTGLFNPESNVQFGEGGAGTFSDGKLNTLVHDPCFRMKKVFEIFVECGAPKEILYRYNPHIGTDILVDVVKKMREKIIEMGGEFYYQTCLTDLILEKGRLKEIEVNHQQKIACDTLVLAIGHSSRDTFSMLYEKGLTIEAKPFAVGLRVEHPQEMINESQYGKDAPKILGPASYKLTYKTTNGRGVYSFCMCPGGYVVNASSQEHRLVINGMSNYDRESKNANSAIIVTVFPKDFGFQPLDGVKYQEQLEKKAYQLGKGMIPVQLLQDFQNNQDSTAFGKVEPVFCGMIQFANLNSLFSKEICDSLKEAFPYFGKKIQGFDRDDAILAGVESRTSSPVRMVRDEFLESNIQGIYPCGEGAGYAGGITSSAMDGMKVAEAIAKRFDKID